MIDVILASSEIKDVVRSSQGSRGSSDSAPGNDGASKLQLASRGISYPVRSARAAIPDADTSAPALDDAHAEGYPVSATVVPLVDPSPGQDRTEQSYQPKSTVTPFPDPKERLRNYTGPYPIHTTFSPLTGVDDGFSRLSRSTPATTMPSRGDTGALATTTSHRDSVGKGTDSAAVRELAEMASRQRYDELSPRRKSKRRRAHGRRAVVIAALLAPVSALMIALSVLKTMYVADAGLEHGDAAPVSVASSLEPQTAPDAPGSGSASYTTAASAPMSPAASAAEPQVTPSSRTADAGPVTAGTEITASPPPSQEQTSQASEPPATVVAVAEPPPAAIEAPAAPIVAEGKPEQHAPVAPLPESAAQTVPADERALNDSPVSGAVSISTTMTPEGRAWILEGHRLMRAGDVEGARVFFRRAAEAGMAQGALALGSTYDPASLSKGHFRNVEADTAAALEWYRRAHILAEDAARLSHKGRVQR